ncbi:MAG: hypothetical protein M3N26_02460, partial [Pseudomonadota bacterium]|nr:hypothetical protein [Pseudomonadota bacterium]
MPTRSAASPRSRRRGRTWKAGCRSASRASRTCGSRTELIRLLLVRLAGAVPVLLLVSVVSFGLMRLIPGDPSAAIAGLSATPEMVAQIRGQLG